MIPYSGERIWLISHTKFPRFYRSYCWILCTVCPPESCRGCSTVNWENTEAFSSSQELAMYPDLCQVSSIFFFICGQFLHFCFTVNFSWPHDQVSPEIFVIRDKKTLTSTWLTYSKQCTNVVCLLGLPVSPQVRMRKVWFTRSLVAVLGVRLSFLLVCWHSCVHI